VEQMNLLQKVQWLVKAEESSVPPEMGESPIPEGRMRRFHVTRTSSIPSIKQHGLRVSDSRGLEGPIGTYSHTTPKAAKNYGHGHGSIVEFHDDPEHYRHSPTYTKVDVPPENIVAIHHKWHDTYRYIKEHKFPMSHVEDVANKNPDDEKITKAYQQLKSEGYK
jgi:hypothetical protein